MITDSQPLLDLLDELNRVRQSHGLTTLMLHGQLHAAAMESAQMDAERGQISHQEPEHWTATIDRHGYSGPARGEVLAWGQRQPHEVVAAWMDSLPHRAVLLKDIWRVVGVGLAWNDQTPYWCALLGDTA